MTSLYASLENGRPYVLSILRIIVALLFLEHGLQKYFGFPSAGPPMTSLLYVQGAIEIVGGILLLVGAYTRVVAFSRVTQPRARSMPNPFSGWAMFSALRVAEQPGKTVRVH
jgi:hypothetical protein